MRVALCVCVCRSIHPSVMQRVFYRCRDRSFSHSQSMRTHNGHDRVRSGHRQWIRWALTTHTLMPPTHLCTHDDMHSCGLFLAHRRALPTHVRKKASCLLLYDCHHTHKNRQTPQTTTRASQTTNARPNDSPALAKMWEMGPWATARRAKHLARIRSSIHAIHCAIQVNPNRS